MTDKLEINNIKKEYPKSYQALRDIFAKETQVSPDEMLELALIYNHRMLFDFFDKQDISIVTDCVLGNRDGKLHWIYKLEPYLYPEVGEDPWKNFVENRTGAEKLAILAAFKLLEQKL